MKMRGIIQIVVCIAALATIGYAQTTGMPRIENADDSSAVKIHLNGPVEKIDCSNATSNEHKKYCTTHCANLPEGGVAILTEDSGESAGCSEADGFFTLTNSTQCFKAYLDQNTTWPTATSFCESEGLVLAEPIDAVAGELQEYLNDKYGSETYWVNGKGTGPKVYWQRSEEQVSVDGSLWIFGEPGEFSERDPFCLILFGTDVSMKRFPGRPYDTTECNSEWQKQRKPLCERV